MSVRHVLAPMNGMTVYGLAYVGQLTSVAQPVALSYRFSTLYRAAEQAVGGGIQIGALYLPSIISPQVCIWFLLPIDTLYL